MGWRPDSQNTEIVDAASNNFVSISADSHQQKRDQKLDSALENLLEKRSADFILLEPQVAAILFPGSAICENIPGVSLKAFLSLVDTVMFNDDYDGGKKLIPVSVSTSIKEPGEWKPAGRTDYVL